MQARSRRASAGIRTLESFLRGLAFTATRSVLERRGDIRLASRSFFAAVLTSLSGNQA